MPEHVIETHDLSMYYGRQRGIVDLDLAVQQGEVFGFLGPNGAGKTTTQRVLMDILRPTSGQAQIFGLDCQQQSVAIKQRVGYLPGELSLYPGMRAEDLFNTFARVRGAGQDPDYRRSLCERLDLDPRRQIRHYSRGNKQKVGLILALMHKPDLLILDEPTSGLDPLVQQTVLQLVREARQEGRTVFFSSHVLPEVQAVCDRVGIIRHGRLVAVERVEDLIEQQFRRMRFAFVHPPPEGTFELPGVRVLRQDGNSLILEVHDNLNSVLERAAAQNVIDLETLPVTLEEVFLTYYGDKEVQNA